MDNIPKDSREIEVDSSAFVGRGVSVSMCLPVDEPEDDGETYVTLNYRGTSQTFYCPRSLRDFPFIEGEVDPGIYQLEEGDGHHYDIRDKADLSRAFEELPST